jgi:hypothetical protein
VTGPPFTLRISGAVMGVHLYGQNLMHGDQAKWVHPNATSCLSEWDLTRPVRLVGLGNGSVYGTFTFPPNAGFAALCYRFNYEQQRPRYGHGPLNLGYMPPTAFLLFPNIQLVLMELHTLSPRATAIGCSSIVTIKGKGFHILSNPRVVSLFGAAGPPRPTCSYANFGSNVTNTTVFATVLNDTHMQCRTPIPTKLGSHPVRVDFGQLTLGPTPTPTSMTGGIEWPGYRFPFGAFNMRDFYVRSADLTASLYNIEVVFKLSGYFEEMGGAACRFGRFYSSSAVLTNYSYLTCAMPPFPRHERCKYLTALAAAAAAKDYKGRVAVCLWPPQGNNLPLALQFLL